jgi:hypothetical protein
LEEEKAHLIAWIEERRNQNTKDSYSTYSKQYLEYTTLRGFDPKSDISLASFMRVSLERGLSRSTINSSIVSAAADMYRYDDVPMGRGALITQMKKVVSESTPTPSQKKPIEMVHIRRMAVLVKPCFVHVRDFFMILLMTVCMMRESEAVALLATDVSLDMIGGVWSLVVKVQKSKTDQVRAGHTILVAPSSLRLTCPLFWYTVYDRLRLKDSRYLFHQTPGVHRSGLEGLSSNTPCHIVKARLAELGIDSSGYGSHSCRRGGATAAVTASVDLHLVKRHGNWKSDAVYLYIVDSAEAQMSVSEAILA